MRHRDGGIDPTKFLVAPGPDIDPNLDAREHSASIFGQSCSDVESLPNLLRRVAEAFGPRVPICEIQLEGPSRDDGSCSTETGLRHHLGGTLLALL